MLTEDQTYKNAEIVLRAALSQHKVGIHGSEQTAPMGDMEVSIAGAPRSMSFAERVRDGKTGDNRETLSITFEPKLDLRAANDSDVRKAVMDTMQNLMGTEAFKMSDGNALANAYNWDKDKPQADKIDPKFDIVNDGKDNKIHLFLDLPADATHWNVVDTLSGKDTLKLKSAGELQKAPASAEPPATDAPALTPAVQPVVGEGVATGNLAKERAAAANDDKAQIRV